MLEIAREESNVEQEPRGIQQSNAERIDIELRQLALVDRILGLEAQVARLSGAATHTSARDEMARMRSHLDAVYASRTWKIGRAVLRPLRIVRRQP